MEIKLSKEEVQYAIKDYLKIKMSLDYDSAIVTINNFGGANIILIKDGRKL